MSQPAESLYTVPREQARAANLDTFEEDWSTGRQMLDDSPPDVQAAVLAIAFVDLYEFSYAEGISSASGWRPRSSSICCRDGRPFHQLQVAAILERGAAMPSALCNQWISLAAAAGARLRPADALGD